LYHAESKPTLVSAAWCRNCLTERQRPAADLPYDPAIPPETSPGARANRDGPELPASASAPRRPCSTKGIDRRSSRNNAALRRTRGDGHKTRPCTITAGLGPRGYLDRASRWYPGFPA